MIHDAIVPVTCDNKECPYYNDNLHGAFVVGIAAGPDPADIEWDLMDHGWIVINGKHYCSETCAREAEDGKG